jgi:hypothetical protein
MGYVIVAIVLVLLIAGFVLYMVRSATQKSNVSDAGDPGDEQNPLSIIGSDSETPAGDTTEHADEPSRTPTRQGERDSPDVARPVVGGEGEGERSSH